MISFCHQVGKSTVLSTLLPTVLANHVEFGVGSASEVVILSLDLGSLPVEKVRLESHNLWTRCHYLVLFDSGLRFDACLPVLHDTRRLERSWNVEFNGLPISGGKCSEGTSGWIEHFVYLP